MPETLTETIANHFIGRIVTVLTNTTGLPLKDGIAHSQYFTGEMVRVDQHGVYLKHLHTNTMAFYTFPLVGIIEEQYIPKGDPRYAAVQEEVTKKEVEKKKEPPQQKRVVRSNEFVDINELKNSIARAAGVK